VATIMAVALQSSEMAEQYTSLHESFSSHVQLSLLVVFHHFMLFVVRFG